MSKDKVYIGSNSDHEFKKENLDYNISDVLFSSVSECASDEFKPSLSEHKKLKMKLK